MVDLISKFREWREHPVVMVRDLFHVEPDAWQAEVLEAFPHKKRIALLASKGVGKTTLLAWIGWNFLLTRTDPRIAATSISGDALRDTFWAEMAKWQNKCPLLQELFSWSSQKIASKQHPNTWWMSARTFQQQASADQQALTLAGIHEDYVLFLIDESGGMSDAIMATADAALSSCIEGHIIQAGNPTQLGGPLYRAAQDPKTWHVVKINGDPLNPLRSPRISIEWAQSQIDQWGRDHPFVRVNVLGEFPPASFNALIGPDEVKAAMKRYYREYEIGRAPRIIGADIARYGDDSTAFAYRRGIQAYPFKDYRNLNSTQCASILSREWIDFAADAVFIDDTGGFGSGVIDRLGDLGRRPVGVHFASGAHDKTRFENKRAEMYVELVQWIKEGGAIPDDDDLFRALVATSYTVPKGALILEPKAMVKAKLAGRSPDKADALALTFAEPVSAQQTLARKRHLYDWDAFPVEKVGSGEYDPFGR